MIFILIAKVILNCCILGLFFYSKLLPYKDKLAGQYLGLFNFFQSIFEPVTKLLRNAIKPIKVGTALYVDMSQFILLALLLLIYEIV